MNLNSKILVTGYNGQLGFDLVKELKKRGYFNVLGIDKNELDITDEEAVTSFVSAYQPSVIIHCAAWTNVDKAEEYPKETYNVNSLGTKYIAKACKENNSILVYISTDYVFNGEGSKPFEVDSRKDGLSIYGKTKSIAEDFVISLLEKYYIVRTSWVFGINGDNFVKTMLKIADSGKTQLNVVCDQIGSPTYTRDLSVFICDLFVSNKYGVYHATNEGYVSWADFAKEIFKLKKIYVKVNPITTIEYLNIVQKQAKRPLNSRLSKKSLIENGFHLLPNWENALQRFIEEELKD